MAEDGVRDYGAGQFDWLGFWRMRGPFRNIPVDLGN